MNKIWKNKKYPEKTQFISNVCCALLFCVLLAVVFVFVLAIFVMKISSIYILIQLYILEK